MTTCALDSTTIGLYRHARLQILPSILFEGMPLQKALTTSPSIKNLPYLASPSFLFIY